MREKMIATEGHILTNGEIYGTVIYPGEGVCAEHFYEITWDEYRARTASEPTEQGGEVT